MDPRERFTSTVEDYKKHRPDYPAALLDWILQDAALGPGSRVLDVGCGTGISTRALASRGLRAHGIDPNEAMLEAARAEGGDGITYGRADAETLEGVSGPFDAVVGGQSFHWLDLERALPRFAEVLPAGGRVIAFWNLRDARDGFMRAYEELLLARSSEYARVGAEPRAAQLLARGDLRNAHQAAFEGHPQVLDRAGFHGRVWSSSYVKNAIMDREAFDRELDALFDAHAEGGRVRFVYRTLALSFTP